MRTRTELIKKSSCTILLATALLMMAGCKSSSSSPGATSGDTIGANPALPPGSEVVADPESPNAIPPSDVTSGTQESLPVVVIPEDSADEIDEILDQAVEKAAEQVAAQPEPVAAQPTENVTDNTAENVSDSATQSSTSPAASAAEVAAPVASVPEAATPEAPSDPAQETLAEMESEDEGVIPDEVAEVISEPETEEEVEVVEPTPPVQSEPANPVPVLSKDLKVQIIGSVRTAMGWNGSKGFVQFKSNAANGSYLCRLGKKDLIATLNFKPCDGKSGSEAVFDPATFKDNAKDGSHRLQVKVVDGGKQSKVKQRTLYFHSSLNGVALCEHKHEMDEYFKIAQALIDTDKTFSQDTRLHNPFVKIGFIEPEKTQKQVAALKKSWQERFRDNWQDYQKSLDQDLKQELDKTAEDYENEMADLKEEEKKLKLAVEQWEKDNKDLKKRDKDSYSQTLAQLKERRDQRLREIDNELASIKNEMAKDKKEIKQAANKEKKSEKDRLAEERDRKFKSAETSQRKVANVMSLRREFVLSKDRKYLLIRRKYPSRSQGGCGNNFTIGMKTRSKAPGFDSKKVNCQGFVINAEGQGLCLQEDGQALEVVKYATRAWRVLGSGKHDKPFSRKTASENKASDKVLYLPK